MNDGTLVMELMQELCAINGTSGREERVRRYILDKISDKCDCTVTPLGCIIAKYKGRKTPDKKLMISAHMDEVGFIITYINEDGTLSFDCVGGVSPDACAGRQIIVGDGIPGCIGSRPVHNLTPDERKTPLRFSDLCIDIGAKDGEEARTLVSVGDDAYYLTGYHGSRDGYIRSKAIDDRAGCAVMIAMILEDVPEYDTTFTFVTQEEVGLRGARTAAYIVQPDMAIVLEATTAADVPLSSGAQRCCEVGRGAVVSYMDRSTLYDHEMYELSRKKAQENDIPWQTKSVVAGGNDSGAIHISCGGVRTMAISVPCRYLHTPCCVAKREDIVDTYRLACVMEKALYEEL